MVLNVSRELWLQSKMPSTETHIYRAHFVTHLLSDYYLLFLLLLLLILIFNRKI
jgi:hypothetical protein